jgi:fucose 4-O-acetylase-like acetyltransferase
MIVVMSALYLLVFLSKKIESKKNLNFLKYIGRKSFSIMAFHFIGFKIGGVILNLLGIKTDISLLVPK